MNSNGLSQSTQPVDHLNPDGDKHPSRLTGRTLIGSTVRRRGIFFERLLKKFRVYFGVATEMGLL